MSDPKPIEPVSPPDPQIKPPEPITPPAADGGIKGIEGAAPAPGKELRNKEAKPYFLKEEKSTDRMRARFAARVIDAATPLIDGVNIFTELEKSITGAKSSVLLAYWAITFSTKLVTDPSRTWADMLIAAAASGVKVRVLINDFDPGFQTPSHLNAWLQLGAFLFQGLSKAKVSPDALQVVVSRHAAEVPATALLLHAADLYDNVASEMNKVSDLKKRQVAYGFSPGVWDKIVVNPKTGELSPITAHKVYAGYPASHHQKLAIIDGRVALTGGLNIVDTYIDTDKHDKKVDKDGIGPWHDAYVKIEGEEIIRDLITNYVGLWNQGKAGMDAFLTAQKAALKDKAPWYTTVTPTALKESDIAINTVPKTTPPAVTAQIRRTVSIGNPNLPFFTNVRRDVLDGYLLAIGLAEELIYIENQYLRETTLGKAIIDRHKQKADLRTIIVLPTRSEELVRQKGDPVTKFGAALQWKIIDDMQKQIGSNVGFFAMERKDKAIVYVHSKLLIVDDKLASIGSSNANPRSLFMDTELDFVWFDTNTVPELRLKLWKEILGNPADIATWKPKDYVKKWNSVATANKTARASKLKGYVRPFVNDAKGETGIVNLGPYS